MNPDEALIEAWYAGWRAHRGGQPCRHGYGPGDHHWESGWCVREPLGDEVAEPAEATR